VITSSAFTFENQQSYLEDDGVGNMNIITSTGTTHNFLKQVGTVDYDTGLLSLFSFFTRGTPVNQFYDSNVVAFNFPIERDIILPLRNRILTIDENDPQAIQLEAIAEN
jgi:hypothetical protein